MTRPAVTGVSVNQGHSQSLHTMATFLQLAIETILLISHDCLPTRRSLSRPKIQCLISNLNQIFISCFSLVIILHPATLAAQTTTSLGGEWRGGILNGTKTISANCIRMGWMETTLGLHAIDGKPTQFRAILTFHVMSVWINPNRTDISQCRFYNEALFTPFVEGVSRQWMEGSYDPSSRALHMKRRYMDCKGTYCGVMFPDMPTADSSQAKIDLVYPTDFIVGLGTLAFEAPPKQWFVLRRTGDIANEVIAPRKATDSFEQAINNGDAAAVAKLMNFDQPEFLAKVPTISASQGRIVGHTPINTVFSSMPKDPTQGGGEMLDWVLLTENYYTDRKTSGVAFYILHKENDEWKIQWLQFQ